MIGTGNVPPYAFTLSHSSHHLHPPLENIQNQLAGRERRLGDWPLIGSGSCGWDCACSSVRRERPSATPVSPATLPALPSSTAVAFETAAATVVPQNTWPPTWTPAPTMTSAPTRTPTLSPTPLPTLTSQQVCAQFSIIATPAENAQLDYDTAHLAGAACPTASVGLSIVARQQEGCGSMPVTGDSLPDPLVRLYGVGQFDRKPRLHHPHTATFASTAGRFSQPCCLWSSILFLCVIKPGLIHSHKRMN
jgi:hypothetical protein